nr:MAG TPA: hypothetical protein [Bacteriophage sp.]
MLHHFEIFFFHNHIYLRIFSFLLWLPHRVVSMSILHYFLYILGKDYHLYNANYLLIKLETITIHQFSMESKFYLN